MDRINSKLKTKEKAGSRKTRHVAINQSSFSRIIQGAQQQMLKGICKIRTRTSCARTTHEEEEEPSKRKPSTTSDTVTTVLSNASFLSRFSKVRTKTECPSVLIEELRWTELNQVLDSKKSICECERCQEHQSLLHRACCHRLPMKTLVKCIGGSGDGACHADFVKNRHPLHVALWHGASAETIECLLRFDKSAGKIQDIDGCTPLSLLFQNFPRDWSDESLVDIFVKLCDLYPISLTFPDSSGSTAIDYATIECKNTEMLNMISIKHEEAKSSLFGLKRVLEGCRHCNKYGQYLVAVGSTKALMPSNF